MNGLYVVKSASSLATLLQGLRHIDFSKQWLITIKRLEPGSSYEQECVLRGMEDKIAKFTGEDPDDVHENMLCMHYGTESVELHGGRIIQRPLRRTRTGKNKLGHSEMTEHMRYVEAFASRELGLQV